MTLHAKPGGLVIVLGAGASSVLGTPLMAGFLDKANDIYRNGLSGPDEASFEEVLRARALLQSVHSKSELDLVNIESLFGAFEMARLLRTLPGLQGDEIDRLPVSLSRLIVRTIEFSTLLNTAEEPMERYGRMALAVAGLSGNRRVSFLSFNYDVAVEAAFRQVGVPNLRYSLRAPGSGVADASLGCAEGTDVELLKLHGSVNWVTCPACNKISAAPVELSQVVMAIDFRYRLDGMKCGDCGKQFDPETPRVIVPPSWAKGPGYQVVESVWRSAALALANAEDVFVIGYSLPPTDQFFRHLWALGSAGDRILKRFWVFDIEARHSSEVAKRFESLLGAGARSRFKYFDGGVWKGFEAIEQLLEP